MDRTHSSEASGPNEPPQAWYKYNIFKYGIKLSLAKFGGDALRNFSESVELLQNVIEPLCPWLPSALNQSQGEKRRDMG